MRPHKAWLSKRATAQGGTPYNGLYWEAPPERGRYLFQASVYKRVGISQFKVYKRVGKLVTYLLKRVPLMAVSVYSLRPT